MLAQAQGKPYANLIGIVATLVYCYCAFVEALYGEIIIGLILTVPTCVFSYIVWMRNKRNKVDEGEILVVNYIKWREVFLLILTQIVMGVGYYFFLRALGTEQLIFSTITLATSVMDAYLLLRRTALALYLEVLDNLLTAGLWLMLAINGGLDNIVFVVQYLFLFFYSFYGAVTWNKYREEQNKHAAQTTVAAPVPSAKQTKSTKQIEQA